MRRNKEQVHVEGSEHRQGEAVAAGSPRGSYPGPLGRGAILRPGRLAARPLEPTTEDAFEEFARWNLR